MDFHEVADELYGLHPGEFMAARTEREQAARADGDRALAADIKSLGKPSTAAWVCNLLIRAQREEIEGLVELGGLLREAQDNLAGDQLKALDVQRRQLVNALTRQARALAHQLGHPITTTVATQVEETLRAAMADPEAGEALLTGRLTSPMSYSGLGTASARPDLRLVPPPKPEKRPPAAPAGKAPARQASPRSEAGAERREREREERRRAAEEKHRREVARAREVAREAAEAAAEARAAAEEQRGQADELAVEHADLQARVEELADQLADAERAAGEASAALKRAQRRRGAAEREADEAEGAADRAAAHVAQLASRGPG